MEGKKLDVGSGGRHLAGYVSLDKDRATTPNVLHDIEIVPWPFADNSFDEVRAHHIFEHVHTEKKTAVMYEAWRVLKPGGVLDIEVPLFPFEQAVMDPTHVSFFVRASFWYYEADNRFRDAFAARSSEPVPKFAVVESKQTDWKLNIMLRAVKP